MLLEAKHSHKNEYGCVINGCRYWIRLPKKIYHEDISDKDIEKESLKCYRRYNNIKISIT